MDKVSSVEDLEVFKLAHQLSLRIYQITLSFPKEEQFGLVAQMRRACSSIPSNLAEGAGRLNSNEYRHFVGIARGSAAEISYQLRLVNDLNFISIETFEELSRGYLSVSRMLTRLAQSLLTKKH